MNDKTIHTVAPEAGLSNRAEIARDQIAKRIKSSGAGSDTQLAVAVKKLSRTFLALDPDCVVEVALLEALCGEGSEQRLLSSVLKLMPSLANPWAAAESLQALSQLVKGEQFQYAQMSAKSKCNTVLKWVQRITADTAPGLENASDCDLLLEVSTRLQFFCRSEKTGPEEQDEFGVAALTTKFNYCEAKFKKANIGDGILADAAPLAVFGFLALPDMKAKIDELLLGIDAALGDKALTAAAAPAATAPAGSSKDKKAAGKKESAASSSKAEAESAVKKAMALFGS